MRNSCVMEFRFCALDSGFSPLWVIAGLRCILQEFRFYNKLSY
ncbi:hypothetical protein [Helicobacter bilis]|nr:hypothetical protein [Helicobacter bilis]